MVFPVENKLFVGDFCANLDETNADMVQFTKRWNWKRLSNINDTFAESLQLQMSVRHCSMCIFKASLSCSYDCWAKYKEKVPDVSDPNQNVETTCNSKLKLT